MFMPIFPVGPIFYILVLVRQVESIFHVDIHVGIRVDMHVDTHVDKKEQ